MHVQRQVVGNTAEKSSVYYFSSIRVTSYRNIVESEENEEDANDHYKRGEARKISKRIVCAHTSSQRQPLPAH